MQPPPSRSVLPRRSRASSSTVRAGAYSVSTATGRPPVWRTMNVRLQPRRLDEHIRLLHADPVRPERMLAAEHKSASAVLNAVSVCSGRSHSNPPLRPARSYSIAPFRAAAALRAGAGDLLCLTQGRFGPADRRML